MSSPNAILAIDSPRNTTDPQVPSEIERISQWYPTGGSGCSSLWRDAALVVPSALLVMYLGFQAKRHLMKLRHRKSHVMIAYYALLWTSALFNFAWSFLQRWRCAPGKMVAWNSLSLFTEFGMLSLEISIVAFLLQENYAGGLEALAHTFMVSGSLVAVDVIVQAIFIFAFGVPLFVSAEATHWGKWTVLFMHALVLTAVYCYILFVHYSKWRDKLPPRPSFYNYVVVMFIVNIVQLFASGLAGIGFTFGIWLYNFMEEDWLLDNAYYSEMKDAGFFDSEWDN